MQIRLSRIIVFYSLITVCLTAMAGAVRYSLGKGLPATHAHSEQQEARTVTSNEQSRDLPSDKIHLKTSPDVVSVEVPQAKAIDPVTLYANSRDAVATILTKDDLGFDVTQGSGFFLPEELLETHEKCCTMTKLSAASNVLCAYLLTNYHVIRSAADATVRLNNGRSGFIAKVVTEKEDVDLAVVLVVSIGQASNEPDAGMPIATLDIAKGPELPVGQKVYAIGSPKGLEASFSEGIVSGKRDIAEGIWWLQTTAPISPGSSGGPLLNSSGEVIGLVTAQRHGGQNLNFAVPASQIRDFLKRKFNSRPLWRGTGIEEEERDAYMESVHLENNKPDVRLWKANGQIVNGKCDDAFRGLANIVPSEFGKYEYLVFYTFGCAVASRGQKQIVRLETQAQIKTVKESYEHYRNNKDHLLAMKYFLKSIELNPQFSPAYKHLAECLSDEASFAEAFEVADSLVKMVPRCATAYKLRGGIYSDLDHHLEALSDFETAAGLSPNYPYTYWHIGHECLSLRDNAKAIEAFETALRLKSSLADDCQYNIGLAYKGMGMYAQAIACFKEAKRLGYAAGLCDYLIDECQKRL
jgi:S1-C subfamily serine protease/tetratricopeptide (TPR) repeat protein